MNTVTLKHVLHTMPRRFEPFYDGHTFAIDGVVTLPRENVNQIRAVFHRGYRLTVDGRWLNTFQELDSYIAQSEGEGHEPQSADRGGQSPNTNRVRAR